MEAAFNKEKLIYQKNRLKFKEKSSKMLKIGA
jgi:hypothetical protein